MVVFFVSKATYCVCIMVQICSKEFILLLLVFSSVPHLFWRCLYCLNKCSHYFSEAEGRRDDNKSSGSGIIKLGAIRDIMDKVK